MEALFRSPDIPERSLCCASGVGFAVPLFTQPVRFQSDVRCDRG